MPLADRRASSASGRAARPAINHHVGYAHGGGFGQIGVAGPKELRGFVQLGGAEAAVTAVLARVGGRHRQEGRALTVLHAQRIGHRCGRVGGDPGQAALQHPHEMFAPLGGAECAARDADRGQVGTTTASRSTLDVGRSVSGRRYG